MFSPPFVAQAENAPPKCANASGPVRRVCISTFALGKHEVTREHYATFVVVTGYHKAGGCKYWTGTKYEIAADKDWRNPVYPQ